MHDDFGLAPLVQSLPAKRLRVIILELARTEESVRRRLLSERTQKAGEDPIQIAARFQTSLDKLLTVRRRAGFNAWDEADTLLDRVEAELLPVAPRAALDLVEQIIASEEVLFSDTNCDSEGALFLENACTFWLYIAAHCGGDQQTWVGRVCDLYYADDYGARDALLSQAHILLEEPALRALGERIRGDLAKDTRGMESALKLLEGALRDQKHAPMVHP